MGIEVEIYSLDYVCWVQYKYTHSVEFAQEFSTNVLVYIRLAWGYYEIVSIETAVCEWVCTDIQSFSRMKHYPNYQKPP